MRLLRIVACAAGLLLLPIIARAQDAPPALPPNAPALFLYLDCNVQGCDYDYLRTELTWINYVRDQGAAQVQVISTSLGTGSGGSEVTLKFIGSKQFAGIDDEIKYTTAQDASSEERRAEFTRVLKVGLARYLMKTPFGKNLSVTYRAPSSGATAQPTHDPWDFWVFSVGVNGFFNGESQSKSNDLSANFSASRVTEAWKFRLGISGDKSSNSYDLGEDGIYKSNTHSYYGNGLAVRSLGPHASAGVSFSGSSSTQQNLDLSLHASPTFEYDFFKYEKYTTRRLIFSYSVGVNFNNYTDTTIYDKLSETLLNQSASLGYSSRQKWGNANISIFASNYLHDFNQHRFGISGGMSIRLVKGLNFNYDASYSKVHDQLTLRKAGATDEEVLLRLRQLQTSYQYFGFFGLSYTFGSVLNNVVNPRMGNNDCC